MKKLMYLLFAVALLSLTMCQKEQTGKSKLLKEDVTNLLINKSTIYKVEKAALWTTTLNQLQVITKFIVTSSTQIYLNDKPATLSQLKPGFKVIIYYYISPNCTSTGGCNIAVKILAYSTITPS